MLCDTKLSDVLEHSIVKYLSRKRFWILWLLIILLMMYVRIIYVLWKLYWHLQYAFLGEDFTLPVIILAYLSKDKEERLLGILRRHKFTLGWSISNIKSINPTIWMHKNLMENNYKPSIEHQRRLNLAIKEVVHAEVLKLLLLVLFMLYQIINGWV